MTRTMTITRLTTVLAVAATSLLGGTAATSASPGRVDLASGSSLAGHLVYLTKDNEVDVVAVHDSGATSTPSRVGPVSMPGDSESVRVDDLVASGDGKWVAWAEAVTSPTSTTDVSGTLVLRRSSDGHEYTVNTSAEPVGFAGHVLVATNDVKDTKVVLTPSPHLVRIKDVAPARATYPHGVVDDPVSFPKHSNALREHVRLHSFGGAKRTLFTYTDTAKNLRSVELCTVSNDGDHLVVERGDKTDFGGVGPSSAIDEFALHGAPQRKRLGHYGSAAAQWRAGTETYVGQHDQVWVSWYRAAAHGVPAVVAKYADGAWRLVATHAITAIGNARGFVVLQPGKWALAKNSEANQHVAVPTADAVLLHQGHQHALDVEGSAFVWTTG